MSHWKRWALLVIAVALLAPMMLAASGAVDLLLDKARSLEGRGRSDLAAQTWQQVLLADPNQAEALAGLARWAKQSGQPEEARKYLDRLKRAHPGDPAIARIEAMKVLTAQQHGRLDEAGRLARAGRPDDAFRIYREIFGEEPPLGEWSVAYYETEAASANGREPALAALHQLVQRYPSNEAYKLSLGRLLTYDPKTRMQGVQILASLHGANSEAARQAWRQALNWEASSPAYQASIREYLKRYPDRDLSAQEHKIAEKTAAQRPAKPEEPAGDPDEDRGYKALNAGNLEEAQARFESVLKRHPNSGQALAGLGFVNMKKEDFENALHNFEDAVKIEPQNKAVQQALESAHFWTEMKHGNLALQEDRSDDAINAYQQALSLRPTNAEATIGLAGSLMKKGDVQSALPLFKKVAEADPQNAPAWRGYVTALYKAGNSEAAIQAYHRLSSQTRDALENDADLLTALALANQATGQQMEAERMLRRATQIAGQQSPRAAADIQLQFANTMLDQGQAAEAAAFFKRVADRNPDNLNAWQGLLAAYLRINDYARAIAAIKAMPQGIYAQAVRSGPFLNSIAAIYIAQGEYDSAEAFLHKALELPGLPHGAQVNTQLQLANVYMHQQRLDKASELYQNIVDQNENDPDAWRGYLNGLHEQKDDDRAMAEAERMPDKVRKILEKDANYLALMASVHVGIGDSEGGIRLLQEARWPYDVMRKQPPADLDIQLAWSYLDAEGREKELYALLTTINLRNDLTPNQRENVRKIWSTWSLRRSQQSLEAGDEPRAIAILTAAAQALPMDNKIRAGLAGMFLRTGDTRRALLVYEKWGMQDAEVEDYLGAIGAAMSVQANQLAEHWMKTALQRWPKSASLLELAGKQAAARGDYSKAEAYWKAALEAIPADSSRDSLFGILGYGKEAPHQSQATQSLAKLLMPDGELPPVNRNSLTRVYTPRTPSGAGVAPAESALPAVPKAIRQQMNNHDSELPTTSTAPATKTHKKQPQSKQHDQNPAAMMDEHPAAHPISLNLSERDSEPQDQGNSGQSNSGTPATTPPVHSGELTPRRDTTPQEDTDQALGQLIERKSSRWDSTFIAPGKQEGERQEIEDEINAVHSRNTPFFGGGTVVTSRSGTAGFDRAITEQGNISGSFMLGEGLRAGVEYKPTFIYSGQPDLTSTLQFGTLGQGQSFPSQSASGAAADVQLSTQNFGAMVGMTPEGFWVRNMEAGLRWKILGGPFTVQFNRSAVTDTLLSYSGTVDPGTGLVWGGVMSTGGLASGNWGGGNSGIYAQAGYDKLTGHSVENNSRISGTAGTYWKVLERPQGRLTVGVNLTGMHYDQNLRYFTLGQGGYFSPQSYFLFNAPIKWVGKWERMEYSAAGSLGSQFFSEDPSPYFPLTPLKDQLVGPYYAGQSKTGANYNLEFKMGYRMAPNWFIGAFVNANNTADYSSQAVGFSVRYLLKQSPSNFDLQLNSIPDWKGVQFFRLQ
jgi:tetratricopeptide (TPR) repeat protein